MKEDRGSADDGSNTGAATDARLAHQAAGALVIEARAGSHAAWSSLVDRYSPTVIAIARRHGLNGSDVDDVHQTVWLRLAENLENIREPDRIAGWLASTSRNESVRHGVRAARTLPIATEVEANLPASQDAVPEDRLVTAETSTFVAQAFGMLEDRCRRILTATVVEERAYTLVADELGIPVGSIGATRRRCLEKLRAFLGASGVLT